jgi:hypothetical protein
VVGREGGIAAPISRLPGAPVWGKMTRNTQGVRLTNPKEGDKIASLAKVVQEEETEGSAGVRGNQASSRG